MNAKKTIQVNFQISDHGSRSALHKETNYVICFKKTTQLECPKPIQVHFQTSDHGLRSTLHKEAMYVICCKKKTTIWMPKNNVLDGQKFVLEVQAFFSTSKTFGLDAQTILWTSQIFLDVQGRTSNERM